MKSDTGLTALRIIKHNATMADWLNLLYENGIIGKGTLGEAEAHFGLKRGKAAWLLFFKRIFGLLGVVLAVCGLIFFMAWNWEDMHRLAKFATLEVVFVLLGAYSVLRWRAPEGGTRWDARIALFGAALLVGGMLALYGQVYQTGADPWELFRAWTIMLIILALAGRATAFWFMVWLIGSVWLGLYLATYMDILYRNGGISLFILYLALIQFAMLAVNEIAGKILNGRGIAYDPARWLSRIIGSTAIVLMACSAIYYPAAFEHRTPDAPIFVVIYPLSLILVGFVYYKLVPELLFLSLSIFSLATFITEKIGRFLFRGSMFELENVLLLGLLILALAFGSLKLILLLNKNIRERVRQGRAAGLEPHAAHSLGVLKGREEKKAELKEWLIGRGAATAENIEACYAESEKERDMESPWYAKVFVCIGVWAGSAAALGAFTGLVFSGLSYPSVLGVLGLVLCGLSIHLGLGKKLALRAFAQVLGVCGLIYAALLFGLDEEEPTLFLLMLLFALFWLLKPPFAARLGAFLGALACLFLFLHVAMPASYQYTGTPTAGWYLKTSIYGLALLWSVHYLVAMDGRPPAEWKKSGPEWLRRRMNPAEILGASAYACLIFCAGLAILLPIASRGIGLFPSMLWLDLRLGTALSFAALTGLLAWRYPALRAPVLLLGPLLAVGAWFAPYLALGFGLLLLAFHTGRNSFLGAAVAYMGCATWLYYYNLELTLLYKSLVLMGSGLVFLVLGLALSRLTAKEVTQ